MTLQERLTHAENKVIYFEAEVIKLVDERDATAYLGERDESWRLSRMITFQTMKLNTWKHVVITVKEKLNG